MIKSKIVNLNTAFSQNASHSAPLWTLSPSIEFDGFLKIKNINVPLSSYNIDTNNNKLKIYEKVTGSTTSTYNTVTISAGNYNSSNLTTILQNSLNSQGSLYYTVSFSTFSNLLTITQSSGSFSFNSVGNAIYNELGIQWSSLGVTSANSITSDNPIDLSGIKNLYITSNIVSYDSGIQINGNTAFCSIPVNSSTNTIDLYQDDSNDYIECNTNNLNYLQLNLYDNYFRPINQKTPWSISLSLSQQYENLI